MVQFTLTKYSNISSKMSINECIFKKVLKLEKETH